MHKENRRYVNRIFRIKQHQRPADRAGGRTGCIFRRDRGIRRRRYAEKDRRIVEIYEDKAVIQVFEGSENISLKNTHTKLTGHPMEIALSPDILGRTFNGIGNPIDGLGPIASTLRRDVNGSPLNPVKREYPRNYIRTGISAIDGLTTLIRGQKLPTFSGNGLPMTNWRRRL